MKALVCDGLRKISKQVPDAKTGDRETRRRSDPDEQWGNVSFKPSP